MSVDEVQAAVSQLSIIQAAVSQFSIKEVDHLIQWLEEYRADLWDEQIEADILAGKLDHLVKRTDEEFEAGRCTPLL